MLHETTTPNAPPMHVYGERKHSGVGIASFVLAIFSSVALFALFVVAGVMEASTPGGINEESPEAVVVGLCLFAFLFLCFFAFVLGIGSLFQGDRKKLFGILGSLFAMMTLLGTVALVILGLMAGG